MGNSIHKLPNGYTRIVGPEPVLQEQLWHKCFDPNILVSPLGWQCSAIVLRCSTSILKQLGSPPSQSSPGTCFETLPCPLRLATPSGRGTPSSTACSKVSQVDREGQWVHRVMAPGSKSTTASALWQERLKTNLRSSADQQCGRPAERRNVENCCCYTPFLSAVFAVVATKCFCCCCRRCSFCYCCCCCSSCDCCCYCRGLQ